VAFLMPPCVRGPSRGFIEDSLARMASQQLELQDEYVSLLRRASALRGEAGQNTEVLDSPN